MRRRFFLPVAISLLAATIIPLTFRTVGERGGLADASVTAFRYSHSGSSVEEIYSFTVKPDDETGMMTVDFELNCGRTNCELPADEAFLQALSELVLRNELWRWDGFDKNASRVTDGSGFVLDIGFSDGTMVNVRGSNRFPKGFNVVKSETDALFLGYLSAHTEYPEREYSQA